MFKSGAQRTAVVLSEQERHGMRQARPGHMTGAMAGMLGQHFTSLRKPWGRGPGKAFARDKPGAPVKAKPFGDEEKTKPFGAHGGNASRTGDIFGSGSEPDTTAGGDNFGFGGF